MDIIDLGKYRTDKSRDSRDWTPLECLREVLREVEAKELDPSELLILYKDGTNSGTVSDAISYRSAGLASPQAVFLIQTVLFNIMGRAIGWILK